MTDNNQYPLCQEYNNHPKEDLAFCKRCQLNNNCYVFQEYIQPPWVKNETRHDDRMVEPDIKVVTTGKLSAICDNCRHYHGGAKCDAFQEKVPTEIMLGYVSHVRPYEGDQGIQFEPIGPREKKREGKKKRGFRE